MNIQGPSRVGRPALLPKATTSTSSNNIASNREILLLERDAGKQVFEDEVIRIRRENVALQDHLQRALKELKAFQIKFPSAYGVLDVKEHENLPPWTTSVEVVSPLFDAYDIRE